MHTTFQRYFNPELRFITGVTLQKTPETVFDFRLRGSNERKPRHWDGIDFETEDTETSYTLRFRVPENYYNLDIEIAGGVPGEQIGVVPEFFQPRSVAATKALLRQRSMAFLGCARSCAEQIENSIGILSELGGLFGRHKILVFENDSTDETPDILKDLATRTALDVTTHKNLDSQLPARTQRLAFGRNTLVAKCLEQGFDYFCTADLDGVLGTDFNTAGFVGNFQFDGCWDACFPVNEEFYYDTWTIRHPQLCPGDVYARLNSLSYAFGSEEPRSFCIKPLQRLQFDKLLGWLAVDSAFGGMGIYKTSSFRNCRYFGTEHGEEICDHVPFHLAARRQGARLYINPGFVVKGLEASLKIP